MAELPFCRFTHRVDAISFAFLYLLKVVLFHASDEHGEVAVRKEFWKGRNGELLYVKDNKGISSHSPAQNQ